MLLSGLAFENLTKGILIGRKPGAVTATKFNVEQLAGKGGHNLATLAQQVKPALSSSQLDVVRRLTDFVIWAGRYPIAMRSTKTSHPSFISTDPALIDELFDELVEVLRRENPTPTFGFA